jgi:hypothetical protein
MKGSAKAGLRQNAPDHSGLNSQTSIWFNVAVTAKNG